MTRAATSGMRAVALAALALVLSSATLQLASAQGWAAHLDGTSSAFLATPPVQFGTTFTLEAWFYVSAQPSDGLTEFFRVEGTSGGSQYTFKLHFAGGQMRFTLSVNNGGASGWSVPPYDATTWPLNTWMHVAISHDGSNNLNVYVNGASVASGGGLTISPGVNVNTGIVIGASSVPGSGTLQGYVDEVRFWNFERSAGDIAAAYGSTVPATASGLVAYYPFDEGRATTRVRDLTGLAGAFDLPPGVSLYYPGAPGIGSYSGPNAFAEFGGGSSLLIEGGAHVCLGVCPAPAPAPLA
eukprot:tig00020848_g14580.t1